MSNTRISTIDDATDEADDTGKFRVLSEEEWWALVDRSARYYLGMSADEFRRAWRAGAFGPDPDDVPGAIEVGMMLSEDDWSSYGR